MAITVVIVLYVRKNRSSHRVNASPATTIQHQNGGTSGDPNEVAKHSIRYNCDGKEATATTTAIKSDGEEEATSNSDEMYGFDGKGNHQQNHHRFAYNASNAVGTPIGTISSLVPDIAIITNAEHTVQGWSPICTIPYFFLICYKYIESKDDKRPIYDNDHVLL